MEPFAGAAGYSVHWEVPRVILLDKDPNIVGTWQYLIGVKASEIRSLPLITAEQTVDDLDVSPEAKMLIGWWCNKGTTAPSRRLSAWARDPKHADQFWGERVRERVARQVDRIREWQILERDFADAPVHHDATYFVDPPYAEAGKFYRHKFTDFARLAQWCQSMPARVIVCEGSKSADWLPFERHYRGKATTKATGSGAYSSEWIWLSQAKSACYECGNDDPAEGWFVCTDCLEKAA